jgi:hypothetical protein
MVADNSEECITSRFMVEELCPEDGGNTFLQTIKNSLPGYTVSHPRRQ